MFELRDERPRGEDFADRYGVYPDRFVSIQVEGHGQVPEALAKAAQILLVADRLVQKPGRQNHKDEQRNETVKEVHGEAALGGARRITYHACRGRAAPTALNQPGLSPSISQSPCLVQQYLSGALCAPMWALQSPQYSPPIDPVQGSP